MDGWQAGLAGAQDHQQDQNVLMSALLQLQGHTKLARNALLKAARILPSSSFIWREIAAYLNRHPTVMGGVISNTSAGGTGSADGRAGSGGDGRAGSGSGGGGGGKPVETPAVVRTAAPPETRIDLSDGNAYPKESFVEAYGGTKEWELAEMRVDPSDGAAYTKQSFLEAYGGTAEFDQAAPLYPPPSGGGVSGGAATKSSGGGSSRSSGTAKSAVGGSSDTKSALPASESTSASASERFTSPSCTAVGAAQASWAVQRQEVSSTPGKAGGFVAVGHVLTGSAAALADACRAAVKAAHENPDDPEAWAATAASFFAKGSRNGDANNELQVARAATESCLSRIAVASAATPLADTRAAALASLRQWALACQCECLLGLATVAKDADRRSELLVAMMTVCETGHAEHGGDPTGAAVFQVLYARCLIAQGHTNKAVATILASLPANVSASDAWQILAQVFESKGQAAESEACYRQCLATTSLESPRRISIFLRLALLAVGASNGALCTEAASEAVRIDPQSAPVRLVLAMAKQCNGDAKGAKKEFKKAGDELASLVQ
jgi:Tfp pilus assembly protein PilF